MSEAAKRELDEKRSWAEPGSRHDTLVRAAKYVLPLLIGALVLVLAIAPFDKRGDVSFILDKKKVASAQERMRVDSARYTGTDDKGQKFSIIANRAVQPTSEQPIVDIHGMRAELALARGPVSIEAQQGNYNLDRQQVGIDGPLRVRGPDGYRLETSNVGINLKDRNLASRGRVVGDMRLGHFEAGRMTANLGTRDVVLSDGVRLKIRQGAIR